MKVNKQDGSTVLPQNHKDMNVKSIDLMNKMRLFAMAEAFRTSLGSTMAENMTPDAFLSMLLNSEWDYRYTQMVNRLTKQAGFRFHKILQPLWFHLFFVTKPHRRTVSEAFRMLFYYFIIRKSFKKLHNPTTFTIFAPMKRKIRTYGGYFEAFMETLKEKEQEKIQYGLLLLKSQDRLPKKFVKLVRDGIYELRTEYGGNIYRLFFI